MQPLVVEVVVVPVLAERVVEEFAHLVDIEPETAVEFAPFAGLRIVDLKAADAETYFGTHPQLARHGIDQLALVSIVDDERDLMFHREVDKFARFDGCRDYQSLGATAETQAFGEFAEAGGIHAHPEFNRATHEAAAAVGLSGEIDLVAQIESFQKAAVFETVGLEAVEIVQVDR